jgi:outer membrane immunogenic protein
MKKLSALVACCALGFGSPAVGADWPPAAPAPAPVYGPPPVPIFTWTGFYIGANVGYGIARETAQIQGISGSASETLNGIVGGGQLGLNWQLGHFLLGFETDLQATGQQHTASIPGIESEIDKVVWFGTARGRLGVAFDRWLLYATGGIAYGEGQSDFSGLFVGTASSTRIGWAGGGGVEWAFFDNWSARLEYIHLDTGKVDNSIGGFVVTTRFTDEVVRFGINYRFGWGF